MNLMDFDQHKPPEEPYVSSGKLQTHMVSSEVHDTSGTYMGWAK